MSQRPAEKRRRPHWVHSDGRPYDSFDLHGRLVDDLDLVEDEKKQDGRPGILRSLLKKLLA